MSEQVTAIVRARVLPENFGAYRVAMQALSVACGVFPGYVSLPLMVRVFRRWL